MKALGKYDNGWPSLSFWPCSWTLHFLRCCSRSIWMRWLSCHIYIHCWTLKDGLSERNWNMLLTFKLQSTLAPRTTSYYRNTPPPLPGEKRFKKWLKQAPVITYSLYFWNADALMPSPPPARHFTCFSSCYSGHLSTSWKILTRIKYSDTDYDGGK